MILISHRGNINGKAIEHENNPYYILNALSFGYDVEIDVWLTDKGYFLGHDRPQYEIGEKFLHEPNLWIHAKNVEALWALNKTTHCFFHNKDDAILTSKNYIWTYPNKPLMPDSIAVLPENTQYTTEDLKKCYAICSDEIIKYKYLKENK